VPDGHDTVLAVVHDPGPPETLTAMRGAGAALNGSVLRASDCAPARRGNRRAQLPPYPRRKLHLSTAEAAPGVRQLRHPQGSWTAPGL